MKGKITLAVWIRPSAQGTQYVAKKARYNATDGYELSLSGNGKVFVRFNQASTQDTYKLLSLSDYPTDGRTWMHVAATYDGQEIKLYIDGALESSLSTPGLVVESNNLPLSIGAQDDGDEPFAGAVDQLHIHNAALVVTEIQDLITSEISGGSTNNAPVAQADSYSRDTLSTRVGSRPR